LVPPTPTDEPTVEPAVGKEMTITVGAKRVDCWGAFPQTCYQVKYSEDGEWRFFYDEIKGFEFEEGTESVLKVLETPIEGEVPADGSSVTVSLVEIVSQTQTPVEPEPEATLAPAPEEATTAPTVDCPKTAAAPNFTARFRSATKGFTCLEAVSPKDRLKFAKCNKAKLLQKWTVTIGEDGTSKMASVRFPKFCATARGNLALCDKADSFKISSTKFALQTQIVNPAGKCMAKNSMGFVPVVCASKQLLPQLWVVEPMF